MNILTKLWSRIVSKLLGKRPGRMKKRWVYKSDSDILNSATINDIDGDGHKEIIFGTKNGTLYVLSSKGKVKWKTSLKLKLDEVKSMFVEEETANSILASPVILKNKHKKLIIVSTASGIISAYHPDGKLSWKFKIKGTIFGKPLCKDINDDGYKEIIVGTSNHYLYALNHKGKLLWKYDAKSAITSPPALYDTKPKLILFGTENGFLKAVNKNGKFRWKFKTGDKISAKPVIADIYNDNNKRIIVGSTDKNLYLLDKFGQLDWKYQTHGEIFSKVTLGDVDQDNDKEIFFGSCDDTLYALAPNSQKIWSYETDFWLVAPPIVTDIDNDGSIEVIIGSYDKSLYVLEGKGTFSLNYLPGLSIIANQPGHFSPFITSEPGELVGKKLWKLNLGNIITGISLLKHSKDKKDQELIVSTKGGKLFSIYHEK